MDRAELAADPRFADNAARIRHLQALDALIVQWCAALDCAQAMAALSAHDIPFSKVYSAADAMQDPHFAERGSFISLPDPDLGCLAAPAPVPRFTGRSAPAPRTGPATGQDNARIYAALGVDAQQQERLRREGVI
jgi:crotonobetainyl-CoA:carnitine CoA-transferase CaiB-like acyl-CoA transferase